MSEKVDARGLSCPQPVIMAQKAISGADFPVEVMVDTVTSRENVRRMAEHLGYKVTVEQQGDEFRLVITK
ncbi:MAG: SirA family protein [Anaerolineae bacterium]|nr:SirA family protein [Anaerolineae bacterium]